MFKCYTQEIKDVNFLELCRALDHCQIKSDKYLLNSDDIKEVLRLSDFFVIQAASIKITAFGCYSGPGQQYPRRCTRLMVSRFKGQTSGTEFYTGRVSRIDAPVSPFFHGPRFVVSLHKPIFNTRIVPGEYTGPRRDPEDIHGESYIINSLALS